MRRFNPRMKSALHSKMGRLVKPLIRRFRFWQSTVCWGKEIALSGQTLRLCYAAKNQLISDPITDMKSHHQYSFVFDLSVQTTPPGRKALLLCQMSIRRWIPDNYNKERTPFLTNAINSHIKISEDKYCQVPIIYGYAAKTARMERAGQGVLQYLGI